MMVVRSTFEPAIAQPIGAATATIRTSFHDQIFPDKFQFAQELPRKVSALSVIKVPFDDLVLAGCEAQRACVKLTKLAPVFCHAKRLVSPPFPSNWLPELMCCCGMDKSSLVVDCRGKWGKVASFQPTL
jgi:hypothetical protein